METFYTTAEAAKKAGLKDTSAIRHAIRRNKLNARKFGRDWVIDVSEFERWLNSERHRLLKETT